MQGATDFALVRAVAYWDWELHSATCAICRSDLEQDQRICIGRCGHGFHAKCLKPWLKKRAVCPLCMQPWERVRVRSDG